MGTVPISTTISAQQLFSIAIFLKDPAMFSMQGTIILVILVSSFNVKGDSGLIEVQDRKKEMESMNGLFGVCMLECKDLNRGDDFSCVSKCAYEKLDEIFEYYDGNYDATWDHAYGM